MEVNGTHFGGSRSPMAMSVTAASEEKKANLIIITEDDEGLKDDMSDECGDYMENDSDSMGMRSQVVVEEEDDEAFDPHLDLTMSASNNVTGDRIGLDLSLNLTKGLDCESMDQDDSTIAEADDPVDLSCFSSAIPLKKRRVAVAPAALPSSTSGSVARLGKSGPKYKWSQQQQPPSWYPKSVFSLESPLAENESPLALLMGPSRNNTSSSSQLTGYSSNISPPSSLAPTSTLTPLSICSSSNSKSGAKGMGCGHPGYITCTICNATKYYSHVQRRFGQFCCEPCSKFMKRFLRDPKQYSCSDKGNCQIGRNGEQEPRGVSVTRCKSCWLKICLEKFTLDSATRSVIDKFYAPKFNTSDSAKASTNGDSPPVSSSIPIPLPLPQRKRRVKSNMDSSPNTAMTLSKSIVVPTSSLVEKMMANSKSLNALRESPSVLGNHLHMRNEIECGSDSLPDSPSIRTKLKNKLLASNNDGPTKDLLSGCDVTSRPIENCDDDNSLLEFSNSVLCLQKKNVIVLKQTPKFNANKDGEKGCDPNEPHYITFAPKLVSKDTNDENEEQEEIHNPLSPQSSTNILNLITDRMKVKKKKMVVASVGLINSKLSHRNSSDSVSSNASNQSNFLNEVLNTNSPFL